MNEVRRAGLSQIAFMLNATLVQVDSLLNEERNDVQDLPDNIEGSEFADRVLKRPMFELAHARVLLLESVEHINSAIEKDKE